MRPRPPDISEVERMIARKGKEWTVGCDSQGCWHGVTREGTAAQARSTALSLGWQVAVERDWCPDHRDRLIPAALEAE